MNLQIRKVILASWQVLAVTWVLMLTLALGFSAHYLLKNGFDYDQSHLAPITEVDDARVAAQKSLSSFENYRLTFMVGFPESHAQLFDDNVLKLKALWTPPAALERVNWEGLEINQYFSFYRLISNRLMNLIDQHTVGNSSDEELLARSLESLTGIGQANLIPKADDPLGFFDRWAQKRLPRSTVVSSGDTLKLYAQGYVWAIFVFQAPQNLENLSYLELNNAIDDLKEVSASIDPSSMVIVHGKPYVGAAAAQTHMLELSGIATFMIIFLGGLIRKWSPSNRFPTLVFFTILSSYVAGLFAVIITFREVSLWSIVCGSSLTGLVVMLVGYFLLVHRHYSLLSPVRVFDKILKPLLWIVVIECMAIALLYIIPLPPIRQAAVFMSSGLLACAITLILIFPSFNPGPIAENDFSKKMLIFSRYFPRFSLKHWQKRPSDYTAVGITFFVILLAGFIQIKFTQNIENLTYVSPEVATEQRRVDSLLSLPNNDKFFIVTASSAQDVLMGEEALRLGFVQRGLNRSDMTTTCISKWFPSYTRQHEIELLRQEMFNRVKEPLSAILGYQLPNPNPVQLNVRFEDWLNSPTAYPVRHLWLDVPEGFSSIVQVAGMTENEMQKLYGLADHLAGVTFVDMSGDANTFLAQYRYIFVGILALVIVCSFTVSLFHYGLRSWRIVVPALLGVASAVSLSSWFDMPFTVFSAMALIVAYGVGLAIALLYYTNEENEDLSFSLTTFGFLSSSFAFCVIGLSSTPALHIFGLTTAMGILSSGIITLLIRPQPKN